MSDAPAPALSDAAKLLAVCKAVWPGRPWEAADDSVQIISQDYIEDRLWTESLDDLRRVLLALTEDQRWAVEVHLSDLHDETEPGMVEGQCHVWPLIAPTQTILAALHEAVCGCAERP